MDAVGCIAPERWGEARGWLYREAVGRLSGRCTLAVAPYSSDPLSGAVSENRRRNHHQCMRELAHLMHSTSRKRSAHSTAVRSEAIARVRSSSAFDTPADTSAAYTGADTFTSRSSLRTMRRASAKRRCRNCCDAWADATAQRPWVNRVRRRRCWHLSNRLLSTAGRSCAQRA